MKWKTFNNSLHFHAKSFATVCMSREWEQASNFSGNVSHERQATKSFQRPERGRPSFLGPFLVNEVQVFQGQTVTFFSV